MTKKTGWIGVDFDGTLATYGKWQGHEHAGEPIAPMVERVKRWLKEGYEVRVMTARMSNEDPEGSSLVALYIGDWTEKHVGVRLKATCTKDYDMIELWDDRAVSVEMNTGRQLAPSTRGLDEVTP